MVAENLNNQPVGKAAFIPCQAYCSLLTKLLGGKKNSFFYSDIWNMKYLPGFKWQHLSEKKSEYSINISKGHPHYFTASQKTIAHERATQKKKLRTELAQVKRENNSYLQKVEQAKMQRHIEERKVRL